MTRHLICRECESSTLMHKPSCKREGTVETFDPQEIKLELRMTAKAMFAIENRRVLEDALACFEKLRGTELESNHPVLVSIDMVTSKLETHNYKLSALEYSLLRVARDILGGLNDQSTK